jgi:arginine/lysine/ornithine decarboxylase
MVKGKLPDDDVRVWDTEELTIFEKAIPSNTIVVIDRPVAISQSVIPSLTEAITVNTKRGVKYQIIGSIPTELATNNDVTKIEAATLKGVESASLVLPYFGMVLYITKSIDEVLQEEKQHWVDVHYPAYQATPVSVPVHIRGFATIPYGVIGAEYAYFAVPLSKADVEQLVRRIWSSK